jgi:hypothetical protein
MAIRLVRVSLGENLRCSDFGLLSGGGLRLILFLKSYLVYFLLNSHLVIHSHSHAHTLTNIHKLDSGPFATRRQHLRCSDFFLLNAGGLRLILFLKSYLVSFLLNSHLHTHAHTLTNTHINYRATPLQPVDRTSGAATLAFLAVVDCA